MVDARDDTASVVKGASVFNADDFASITSYDDVLALVGEKLGGEIIDATELGDGFTVVDDKDSLIGSEFMIIGVGVGTGEHKNEVTGEVTRSQFLSCRLVTKDGRKLVLNDGSTGIYQQITTLWVKHPETRGKPIRVLNGLRKSSYDHPEFGPSTTYYLDTSGKAK